MYLQLVIIIIITLLIGESSSYIWHRYSHEKDTLNKIHQLHHSKDLKDKALEDFLVATILFTSSISVLKKFLSDFLITIVGITFFFTLISDWYIHSSYHTESHWLNKYEWFRKQKRNHFEHHINPKTNFGIKSNFFDGIFSTKTI